MMKAIAAPLVTAVAAPANVVARVTTVTAAEPRIVQVVGSGVSSSSLRPLIEREGARLANDEVGAAALQPRQPPARSWAGRHPAALGVMIGAAGGVVWGAAVCSNACEGHPQLFMVVGAGVGAGIGAGIGTIVSLFRR